MNIFQKRPLLHWFFGANDVVFKTAMWACVCGIYLERTCNRWPRRNHKNTYGMKNRPYIFKVTLKKKIELGA